MTEDDDNMGALFRAMSARSKIKRANNRESSADCLKAVGIPFSTNNGGAHLIVEGKTCFIDFWPGTGRWKSRDGTKGFGVRNLIEHILRA